MKRLILFEIVIILLLYSNSFSQELNWKIKSIRRPPTSIHKISLNNIWIFCGEIAYKSTNNGNSWLDPIKMNVQVGGLSSNQAPESNELIWFTDSLTGWACQYSDELLKTTNGGNNWITKPSGFSGIYLKTIFFLNKNTGWAGGRDNNNKGVLLRTYNGGTNWHLIVWNFASRFNSIYFVDSLKGFAITSQYDTLSVTTDGGFYWNKIPTGTGQKINKVVFTNQVSGWVLGDYSFNFRTTNAGNNWYIMNNNNGNTINIKFLNNTTGWITGPANRIWKTTNTGANWVQQLSNGAWDYSYFNYVLDIHFNDSETGWAILGDGTILKTMNGGVNWNKGINAPYGDITSLHFFDSNTGLAVSNYAHATMLSSNNGFIWKTTDHGSNWTQKLMTQNNQSISALKMLNSSNGFAVGMNKIFKTTTQGENWQSDSVNNNRLTSVYFINQQTGWLTGGNGSVFKTTNTGTNWLPYNAGTTKHLNSAFFSDNNVGYVCGDSGVVCRTTNGGLNWSSTIPAGYRKLKQVYFINSNTGYIVGNYILVGSFGSRTNRILLRTLNGGGNWAALINDTITGGNSELNSIYFNNNQTGLLLTNSGHIMLTMDYGNNWSYTFPPLPEKYFCVSFINSETGWLGGSNGLIMSSGQFNIGVSQINQLIPKNYSLHQNHPNPFNPITNINFSISGSKTTQTHLSVFDILGREIEILVNEILKPGNYNVNWVATNYPSGVYFYKLTAENYNETRKMILIK